MVNRLLLENGNLLTTESGDYIKLQPNYVAFEGASSSTSAASGHASVLRRYSANSGSVSAGSGTIVEVLSIVGLSSSVSAAQGIRIDRAVGFVGISSSVSTGSGLFEKPEEKTGTSSSVSALSGNLDRRPAFTGLSSSVSEGSGRFDRIVTAAGVSSSLSADSGVLDTIRSIAGASSSISALQAPLWVGHTFGIQGTSESYSDADAIISLTVKLAALSYSRSALGARLHGANAPVAQGVQSFIVA